VGNAALLAAGCNARGLFLDYRELPGALLDRLPAHFGISFCGEDRAAILAVARNHAKNPARLYIDDSADKRSTAAHLREMAETIVGPTLAALQARQHQGLRRADEPVD
jgi:hypothetical protein